MNELEPPALTIEETAKLALSQFADHVERQCGSPDGLKPIGDFAAKAAEHAARIAGVLTIVAERHAISIDLATVTDALILAEWYVMEALRLQQAGRRDLKLDQAQALLEWCLARDGDEVPFREVLQFGPGTLRTKGCCGTGHRDPDQPWLGGRSLPATAPLPHCQVGSTLMPYHRFKQQVPPATIANPATVHAALAESVAVVANVAAPLPENQGSAAQTVARLARVAGGEGIVSPDVV